MAFQTSAGWILLTGWVVSSVVLRSWNLNFGVYSELLVDFVLLTDWAASSSVVHSLNSSSSASLGFLIGWGFSALARYWLVVSAVEQQPLWGFLSWGHAPP